MAAGPARQAGRLGVLGGTFDPVHLGHTAVAHAALRAAGLDRVVFIPAGEPPHKTGQVHATAEQRLRMVALATAGEPRFSASRLELDRPGPSYTVDSLRALRAQGWNELFFICGADAAADVPNWHRWRELVAMATFVAVARPGGPAPAPELGARVRVVHMVGVDISSSDIRRRVAEGLPIDGMVAPAVAAYIRKEGLYRA